MSSDERTLYGVTGRARSGATVDNVRRPLRSSRYGELAVSPIAGAKLHALADEGAYFTITNATPGTGIAGHAAPSTSEGTKALLFLRNTATPSDGKRVYLDYIQLQVTAAGTAGSDVRAILRLDKGNNRYTSGGTAITPVNTNIDSTDTSSVTAYCGAVVVAAASADARIVHHQLVRNVINVVGDTYLFTFGAGSKRTNSLAVAGTAIANVEINCPPVVIGPEQMFLLHLLATSQSAAASYELSAGFWVR